MDLETDPPLAGDVLLVSVGDTLTGEFNGLSEGAAVPGSGGRFITYAGGDGNDIVLSAIPEPSALCLALAGLLAATGSRRRR